MTLNLMIPQTTHTDFSPRITVIGVGGGGTNAVDNMIAANLQGVDFVVANTDAQQLLHSRADRRIQLGPHITQGLGAGAKPEIGKAAAEEAADELYRHLDGAHMVFITAGMGGGTGTGAAPVIARMARERNILTVGVVTKPFGFEGVRRARSADQGIEELQQYVDTLIVIPNQNLFRMANERTTWKEAFKMADQVLYMGVRGVTDLMMVHGLVNLDFADIRTVMAEMGKAMMGTGEAEGENRAIRAAEAAINNPLLEDTSHVRRARPADQHHRRRRPDAVRGRPGRQPHPRGSGRGSQHDLRFRGRRVADRPHPRLGRCDRHRFAQDGRTAASEAGRRRRRWAAPAPQPIHVRGGAAPAPVVAAPAPTLRQVSPLPQVQQDSEEAVAVAVRKKRSGMAAPVQTIAPEAAGGTNRRRSANCAPAHRPVRAATCGSRSGVLVRVALADSPRQSLFSRATGVLGWKQGAHDRGRRPCSPTWAGAKPRRRRCRCVPRLWRIRPSKFRPSCADSLPDLKPTGGHGVLPEQWEDRHGPDQDHRRGALEAGAQGRHC